MLCSAVWRSSDLGSIDAQRWKPQRQNDQTYTAALYGLLLAILAVFSHAVESGDTAFERTRDTNIWPVDSAVCLHSL